MLKMKKMVQPGARLSAVICVFACLLVACRQEQHAGQNTDQQVAVTVNVPSFNADSAFRFVEQQVEFGPRTPNSEAHKKCADFLASTLKRYCDTVIIQSFTTKAFDNKMLQAQNIIGSFNPSMGNRIFLSAHWDTRPFADQDSVDKDKPIDGANDGSSGVGILLEVARQLSLTHPQLGVDVILFDVEDYGQPDGSDFPPMEDSYCLGSQYWTQHLHVPGYTARFGVNLDMVGAANATFTQEGTSRQYASEVVDLIWKTASETGASQYFVFDQTNPIIDDHYYVNRMAQIKCADIIHYDYGTRSHFWKHWHTHGDSIDKIDKNTLRATGQTLLEVLFRSV